jgi:glycosyltransferase involved in cell wall biosynthesis
MKISIIVPLYKADLYVEQCFESISSQTYKNIEIVFVDDGSPDKSGQIADRLSDDNDAFSINVIHKSNGGASSARNAGVNVATGDYLLFIDADDFFKNNDSLERIVSYAESKDCPDVVGFNISYFYPSRNQYVNWVKYSEKITNATDKESIVQELVKSGTLPVSPCGKLIKKDTYIKLGIQFLEGTIGEDIPWTIQLFDKVSSIRYMNEYHYCYRQEVTTSVTGCFSEKKFLDLVTIIENLAPLIRTSNFNDTTKECLYSFAGYELSIAMSGVYRLNKITKQKLRNRLKNFCWLLKYTQNPKVRIVSRVYNIFGYAITERVLQLYNWYRSRK